MMPIDCNCLVLWVMLRFNWMMNWCHRMPDQLRQYEIIIIIIKFNASQCIKLDMYIHIVGKIECFNIKPDGKYTKH